VSAAVRVKGHKLVSERTNMGYTIFECECRGRGGDASYGVWPQGLRNSVVREIIDGRHDAHLASLEDPR
jgi:hypothetical protein